MIDLLNNIFFFQWYDFADPQTHGCALDIPSVPPSPRKRKGKTINFFDLSDHHDEEEEKLQEALDKNVIKCVIRERNVCGNAHDGYVYCLLHAKDIPNIEGEVLISGSGDGNVKVRTTKVA